MIKNIFKIPPKEFSSEVIFFPVRKIRIQEYLRMTAFLVMLQFGASLPVNHPCSI